jgi:hypothetical protein
MLSPRHRQVAVLAGSAGAAWLVPWSLHLARTLPPSATADHWAVAWTGLDLAEAAAAGSTAWWLARHDRRAALAAMALAALLGADAWFDVCTSARGHDRAVAIASAVLLELPLAAAAAHLAIRLQGRSDDAGQRDASDRRGDGQRQPTERVHEGQAVEAAVDQPDGLP